MCENLKDVKKKMQGVKNSPLKSKILQDVKSKTTGKSVTK